MQNHKNSNAKEKETKETKGKRGRSSFEIVFANRAEKTRATFEPRKFGRPLSIKFQQEKECFCFSSGRHGDNVLAK